MGIKLSSIVEDNLTKNLDFFSEDNSIKKTLLFSSEKAQLKNKTEKSNNISITEELNKSTKTNSINITKNDTIKYKFEWKEDSIYSNTKSEVLLFGTFFDNWDNYAIMEKNDENVMKKWLSEYKILVPEEVVSEGLDPEIKKFFMEKIEDLKAQWCKVEIKPLPILKDALAIYYTLMPAEVSTNLSRFDGLRFWHQDDTQKYWSLEDYYASIRGEGFWEEAKRRILLGTFVLSSANYEGYYLKALAAQKKLKADLEKVYEEYDVVLTPTSPEVAWKIWEKTTDPLKMYLADLYTVPANLAGLPAISVPLGMVEKDWEKLPIGIHAMWKKWGDWNVLGFAKLLESLK